MGAVLIALHHFGEQVRSAPEGRYAFAAKARGEQT